MILLLLMILSTHGVYTHPFQENCTKTVAKFHNCLCRHHSELIYSDDVDTFKKQKSIFIQCGAIHSNCYLQKTLMTMMDSLIASTGGCNIGECYYMLSQKAKNECDKVEYKNNDGYGWTYAEEYMKRIECYVDKAKNSNNCTQEEIKGFEEKLAFSKKDVYRLKLEQFLMFVKIISITTHKKPPAIYETYRQPELCKPSERAFFACIQKSNLDLMEFKNQKKAFLQCGAEKSGCYLQKHMLKMVNTVIDTKIGSTVVGPDQDICIDKIKEVENMELECMREGFDENGFAKRYREFEYQQARCKAEVAQKTKVCSPNSVNILAESALTEYISVLDGVVRYLKRADNVQKWLSSYSGY